MEGISFNNKKSFWIGQCICWKCFAMSKIASLQVKSYLMWQRGQNFNLSWDAKKWKYLPSQSLFPKLIHFTNQIWDPPWEHILSLQDSSSVPPHLDSSSRILLELRCFTTGQHSMHLLSSTHALWSGHHLDVVPLESILFHCADSLSPSRSKTWLAHLSDVCSLARQRHPSASRWSFLLSLSLFFVLFFNLAPPGTLDVVDTSISLSGARFHCKKCIRCLGSNLGPWQDSRNIFSLRFGSRAMVPLGCS